MSGIAKTAGIRVTKQIGVIDYGNSFKPSCEGC